MATLGALAARTGADRTVLVWAVEEAIERGWVRASGPGCDGGLCGTTAPTMYSLTEAGRDALHGSRA